ncbi:CPBP family intramembrane glutamic endopeptidase [Flavobacteriaceae bacterium 3-367]
MDDPNTKRHIGKNVVLPVISWGIIILVFLNVKNIPYEFSEKDGVVLRYFVKVVMTIVFPLVLIHLLYKNKSDFGIYFPKFWTSFKLSLWAYAVGGPAGIVFMLIGLFGWRFSDWPGALCLALAYLLVFYFVPKVVKSLPTRNSIALPNKGTIVFVLFSLATVIFAYFTYEYIPKASKILYYIFIVGLGEELLFRGYIQSSFNSYFGKPFHIGNVKFGWGMLLSALLFGLMHALVVVPPAWPWALFTLVIGLTLGYIREKDGSILAAVLLHAMLDMPLVFMGG